MLPVCAMWKMVGWSGHHLVELEVPAFMRNHGVSILRGGGASVQISDSTPGSLLALRWQQGAELIDYGCIESWVLVHYSCWYVAEVERLLSKSSLFCLLFGLLYFWGDKVSLLCSSGWPQIHREIPTSVSHVLEFKGSCHYNLLIQECSILLWIEKAGLSRNFVLVCECSHLCFHVSHFF